MKLRKNGTENLILKKSLTFKRKNLEHFELLDVYKAILSAIAGLILGFEREMKDKSAGLKTITVICLGSTLFSILSYKVSGTGDPTRIASYIVSGIGFLGAGVIFKQGFSVRGLTTAGIIWIAAAVGTSIGFGEVYLAFTFLGSALFVIYSAEYLSKNFLPQNHNKTLKLHIQAKNFVEEKDAILNDFRQIAKDVNEVGLQKEKGEIQVILDMHIDANKVTRLENYLAENENIVFFSYQ